LHRHDPGLVAVPSGASEATAIAVLFGERLSVTAIAGIATVTAGTTLIDLRNQTRRVTLIADP
jgi:ABC-type cobalamin transport system permease subunit